MSNKVLKITITICMLFFLMDTATSQGFQPYKSNAITYHGYMYPVVPGTDAWKHLDHMQRVSSLQLPNDTLHDISTERLLETCLYYPFNIDIFAFDDKIESFRRVKEQFNGYAELYQRGDFVQKLINLYDTRDVAAVNNIDGDHDKGLYAFDYHILEYMLTDAAILASSTQSEQIVHILIEKKTQKTRYNAYGSTNRLAIALAIGRCMQRTNAYADYQGTTLQEFLQSGRLTNVSDLDYIYSKIENQ
ncbi:MAG: hypothetical protein J5708_04425 [Bacteroidales bacterium]|nr:hypothetical protein [Bacteroidales bacterium]